MHIDRVNRAVLVLSVLAVVGWSSAETFAETPTGILDGDPSALVSGSANYVGGDDWAAVVSYAVFAPGDYLGTFDGSDDLFIYAYQIFNDAASDATLSAFSVGLLEDAGVVACGDDATYGTAGGEAPLLSRFVGSPATSAQWIIDLDADEYSTVLIFSSYYGYTWDTGVLANGGVGHPMPMPTPSAETGVPEPASLAFVILGGLGILGRKRR